MSQDTVVEVSGGLVQHVYNVDDYIVLDWDNLKDVSITAGDIRRKIGEIAALTFDDEDAHDRMLNELHELLQDKRAQQLEVDRMAGRSVLR